MQKTARLFSRSPLLGFLVRGVLLTKTAILAEFQFIRSISFIFRGRVISLLAFRASQGNDIPHGVVLQLPPSREGRRF